VLASLTSLAIFPVLTETTTPLAKAIVSAVALLAAICALIPRVKNYAELAGQARAVVTEFGTIKEKRVRNDQGGEGRAARAPGSGRARAEAGRDRPPAGGGVAAGGRGGEGGEVSRGTDALGAPPRPVGPGFGYARTSTAAAIGGTATGADDLDVEPASALA
jgi:hypothetical protein